MKKILFLLLILFIKLNAYEYLVYNSNNSSGVTKSWFVNVDGKVQLRYFISNDTYFYSSTYDKAYFYNIKKNNSSAYIEKEIFDNYYKNDLLFLNDLYTNIIGNNNQGFLNYLYNPNFFNSSNYIIYDYELLYNSDGLAVESKVDGIYKGLYDDIGQSGYLYNSIGDVVLVNGVEPSFFHKQWLKLQNKIINPLLSVFSISNIWKNILCVVVILASLRMIIRYAFKAFLIRLYSKRIKHYENTITRIENA